MNQNTARTGSAGIFQGGNHLHFCFTSLLPLLPGTPRKEAPAPRECLFRFFTEGLSLWILYQACYAVARESTALLLPPRPLPTPRRPGSFHQRPSGIPA